MRHPLEMDPLTQLPGALWAAAANNVSPTAINLARCVVFEHNFPKALFASTAPDLPCYKEPTQLTAAAARGRGKRGDLLCLTGKAIDSSNVVGLLCTPGMDDSFDSTSPIADVMYIELRTDSSSVVPVSSGVSLPSSSRTAMQTPRFVTQYLTPRGLHYFVQGASALDHAASGETSDVDRRIKEEVRLLSLKSGLLQWLPHSGEHNEMIQVTWTPRLVLCEKLRNVNSLEPGDRKHHHHSLFDRYSTFDGPPNIACRKFIAPAVQGTIMAQVDEVLRRVAAYVPGSVVSGMTLYFKLQECGTVWLMFCTHLQLHAAPGPEARPVAQAAQIKSAMAVHAASVLAGGFRAGPRPLSLVELSEADVQRDLMLQNMVSRDAALARMQPMHQPEQASPSDDDSRLTAPPFHVPEASKLALLADVTRGATKSVNATRWNELAPTKLAAASGIAGVRTRQGMLSVSLTAKCFMPSFQDSSGTGERGGGNALKSRLAPKMTWLRGTRDLLAHRFTNVMFRRDRLTRSSSGIVRGSSASRGQAVSEAGATPTTIQRVSQGSSGARLVAPVSRSTYADMLIAVSQLKQGTRIVRSCENIVTWIYEFHRAGAEHFRLQPTSPIGVSVPPLLFPEVAVLSRLCDFLEACDLTPCTIDDAVEADRAAHRDGVIDEISFHHNPRAATGGDDSLQCLLRSFVCPSLRSVLRVVSRFEEGLLEGALADLLRTEIARHSC